MRQHVLHAIEGALGGALGTVVIKQELSRIAPRLPDKLKPTGPNQDPGRFMARLVEETRGEKLTPGRFSTLVKAAPWTYGAGWGVLFGLIAPALGRRSLKRMLFLGGIFGAVVWAAGYIGWLPQAKLVPPIHKQKLGAALSSMLMHMGYGFATALPVWAMHELEERLEGE